MKEFARNIDLYGGISMERIRIQNLRSLVDTDYVELKPLTILVGKNSSGKSTFLRFFPLMKQTLETRTNEPILWYSSRYVDFGSFEESVNYKKNDTICFEFEFHDEVSNLFSDIYYINRYRRMFARIDQSILSGNFKYKVRFESGKKSIERMSFTFEDHNIEVYFKGKSQKSKLIINGEEFFEDELSNEYHGGVTNILPVLHFKDGRIIEKYFDDKLFGIFNSLAHTSTSEETILRFINGISIGSSDHIVSNIKSQATSARKLKNKVSTMTIDSPEIKKIINYLIGRYLNSIISTCNKCLGSYFAGVKYIAPLRASAERYYRIQGISVDEIDPQGENIPMILYNMSDKMRKEFSNWVNDNFGFEITTKNEGGHTSLKLRYKNSSDEINLADTGFGFSQILPIIILLWQTTGNEIRAYRANRVVKRSIVIVIEQPELHLHPAIQAKLMDSLAQIVAKSQEGKIPVQIIIETHSETVINRVGYLIAKQKYGISNSMVNVLMFNQNDPYKSEMVSTNFTEKGYLKDWPIGFFSPED